MILQDFFQYFQKEKAHMPTNRFNEKKCGVMTLDLIQDTKKPVNLEENLEKPSTIGFSDANVDYNAEGIEVRRCATLRSISRLFYHLTTGLVAGCIVLLIVYIIRLENLKNELLCHLRIDLNLEEHAHRCQFDTRKFHEDLTRKLRVNTPENGENLNSNYSRCSLRLVLQGDIQSDPNSHNKFQAIKGWSYFAQNTHMALECFTPNEDFSTFMIRKEGTYLISVQLSFFATDELLKKAFKKHMFIGQKVFSGGYQLLQQSSLVSVPQLEEGELMPGCGENRGSLHVSTLTGLIDLEAGDNLTINAIPVNWLCRWKSASFFNIYRID